MNTLTIQFEKRMWWRWLPFLFCCATIFFISHQPRATIPRADANVDYQPAELDVWLGQWGIDRDMIIKKGGHLVGYAFLALLAFWASGNLHQAFWMTLLYALLDEIHQGFVIDRTGRLTDVLLDGSGAAMALLSLWLIKRKWPL